MSDIENTLKTLIQKDRAHTFLIIVPTDSDRLRRQRELVEYHPSRAVANLRVYTLGNFIHRLYDQVSSTKSHISQGLQNLWLHEIANHQSDNSDAYPYAEFRPNENISVPDSTLSLIADTINRLKEYGEETLNIGNGESQNPTEDDLVRIYNDYETRLKDRWIDEQGKRLYLANNFKPIFMRNAFRQVNRVVVEGFTVLSKVDIKILTRIAKKMPEIEMWFRTDCVEENENLYKNIVNLVSQFQAANANIDPDYGRDTKQHQHYAENLFRSDNSSLTPIAAPDIKILKPADRSEEVMQIAHLIKKRVSKGHSKFSEICVASYNMGLYEQRIAEIFPVYGIPYSFVERQPLTRSEVVKAIFSRLSTRTDPLSDDYFSDVEPASHDRPFHPSEFQEYVDDLLKSGRVIQHILNPMLQKNREVVEGEVEAYHQFNRIVKELCSVLMLEAKGSDLLDGYIEKLRHIARHTTYQSRATTKGDTVKIIAQLSELRSSQFKTVFLCDFVEGKFPEDYRPDPLLPNHPYRTEEEHLYNNRFMFYGVLKSFSEQLYLLVPKRERDAELIPSLFLEQLKAIAKVKDDKDNEIADPTQGSVPGFLSAYGQHLWAADTPSNGKFPNDLKDMRLLIDHVVKVENSREETHNLLAYEGVLAEEGLSAKGREHLDSRRHGRYSVTELETYAKCPFQYFASRVLRLYVEEEEEEDLSSLEKGSLLHKVLFTFYNNRRERGDPSIDRCQDNVFEDAKRQLDEILKNASEESRGKRKELPIDENNLFWDTDIEKLRVALYKWLEAERNYDLPLKPSYFEVNFGQARKPEDPILSCSGPIYIGNVRMKGKIDRIDVGKDSFNIVDYKTGSLPIKMPEILNGRSLQLPIYLQIAKKLLKQHNGDESESAAGLYYKVRLNQFEAELGSGKKSLNASIFKEYKDGSWKKVYPTNGQLLKDERFVEVLTRVDGYVQQYVDSISKGYFPLITRVQTFPVPDEGGYVETDRYGFVSDEEHGDKPLEPGNKTAWCDYCDYKRLCRVGAIGEGGQSEE